MQIRIIKDVLHKIGTYCMAGRACYYSITESKEEYERTHRYQPNDYKKIPPSSR